MIDSVLEDLHEGLADRSQSLQGVSIDWFLKFWEEWLAVFGVCDTLRELPKCCETRRAAGADFGVVPS
jgi:hypothetical protein